MADGLAAMADRLHAYSTQPAGRRVTTEHDLLAGFDSVVVSLTGLAGELAGIELWHEVEPSTALRLGDAPERAMVRERLDRIRSTYAARVARGRRR